MDSSVTGFPNAKLSNAAKRRLAEAFSKTGQSQHSGRAETVWAILEYCREEGIPFRVEVAKFEDRPVGARVVRTDREPEASAGKLPAGWVIEIADEWHPEPASRAGGQ